MKYLVIILFIILSGCRSKSETDSFLVMELLQRRQLLHWYTPEQREVLRQEIERVLKND